MVAEKRELKTRRNVKSNINMKDTQHPHYVVYGDTEENVLECTREIEGVLEEANDIKRKEYSQQNS